jgi:site-specific recombinase
MGHRDIFWAKHYKIMGHIIFCFGTFLGHVQYFGSLLNVLGIAELYFGSQEFCFGSILGLFWVDFFILGYFWDSTFFLWVNLGSYKYILG